MPDKSVHELKLEMHRKFNALLDELDALEVAEGDEPHEPPASETAPEPAHDHDEPDSKTLYAAPDSNDTNLLKAITGKFKRGLKPGQSILKAADGQRLMLIVTSNSYKDREDETLTSGALKEDVDRHWTQGDDAFMSSNPLLYWHDDDIPLGNIVWDDMIGPFRVEVAREHNNPVSKQFFDWREASNEKWGASHRFAYFTQHRSNGGDYSRIFKQETSTLPLEVAANLYTLSGVIPMSDKRAKKFDEIMGFDGAYDLIKTEGFDALVGKLSAQGIDHKSTDDTPVQTDAGQKALESIAKAFVDLTEDVAVLASDVDGLKEQQTDAQKAYDDKNAELDETLTAVKELAEKLQERLDARPRSASRAVETEIENSALSKEVNDSLLVEDPVFGKVLPKS